MTKRENQILDYIYQYGELSIQELSDLFGASEPTIRRELVKLNSIRFIERTRGGVRLATVVKSDGLPIYRLPVNKKEVFAIAYVAAKLVKPGSVIGLSGGQLCTQLALNLRHHSNITIVTNAVNIAVELACIQDLNVVLTRGRLNSSSFELVGSSVGASLTGLHIDLFFLSTDGLSIENGVTGHDEAEASVASSFMKIADRTVVLADSMKFKKVSFSQVSPIATIDTIITTEEAPHEVVDQIKASGVKIVFA